MKHLLLLIFALIGSVGCKQEWTSYEEWQIASRQQVRKTELSSHGYKIDSVFLVRNSPSEFWRTYDIYNFPEYEEGFEYVVRVEIHNRKEPPYKGVYQTVFFDKILSKTKKESENIPTDTVHYGGSID